MMSSVNQELYKEIENRASGTLKNIAIEILNQLSEDFTSEERIKDEIRRKVDLAVREETK